MPKMNETDKIENLNLLIQKEADDLRELLRSDTLSTAKRKWIMERIAVMEEDDKALLRQLNGEK